MANEDVKVDVSWDPEDLARMQAEIERINRFAAEAQERARARAALGASTAAKAARSASKGAKKAARPAGFFGRLAARLGLQQQSGDIPIVGGQPIADKSGSTAGKWWLDPSTGGFNRGIGGQQSSSPFRSLLYRARIVASGNLFRLGRASLALWAADAITRENEELLGNAAEQQRLHGGSIAGAYANEVRKSFSDFGKGMAAGAAKGLGAIFKFGTMGIYGLGMLANFVTNSIGGALGLIRPSVAKANVQASNDGLIRSLQNTLNEADLFFQPGKAAREYEARRDAQNIALQNLEVEAVKRYNNFLDSGFFNELVNMGAGTREALTDFFGGPMKNLLNLKVGTPNLAGKLYFKSLLRNAPEAHPEGQMGDQGKKED